MKAWKIEDAARAYFRNADVNIAKLAPRRSLVPAPGRLDR